MNFNVFRNAKSEFTQNVPKTLKHLRLIKPAGLPQSRQSCFFAFRTFDTPPVVLYNADRTGKDVPEMKLTYHWEGLTETMKADNQMEWVQRMNSIRNRAEEYIRAELIMA